MLCSWAVSVYVTYWVSVLTICGAKVVFVTVTVTRVGEMELGSSVEIELGSSVEIELGSSVDLEMGCTSVVVAVGTAMFTSTGKHPSKLSEQRPLGSSAYDWI